MSTTSFHPTAMSITHQDLRNWAPEKVEELIEFKEGQTYEQIYKNIIDKCPATPLEFAYKMAMSLSVPELEDQCVWDGGVGIPPQCGGGAAPVAEVQAEFPDGSDEEYYKFIDDSEKNTIEPFELYLLYEGKRQKVYVLGKMNTQRPGIRKHFTNIKKYVKKEWNCNYCRDYIGTVSQFFDQKGPITFRGVAAHEKDKSEHSLLKDGSPNKVRTKARKETYEMLKCASTPVNTLNEYGNFNSDDNIYNWYPVLVDGDGVQLADKVENGEFGQNIFKKTGKSGGFRHYNYCQPCSLPKQDKRIVNTYSRALKEFTPLFIQMLSRFRDMRGLEDSLELLLKLIDESANASVIKNSVVWFRSIINMINTKYGGRTLNQMSLNDRLNIITVSIFNTRPEEGSDGMVIPWYSQISKSVLDLLENAKSEKAMKAMLEDRFSPKNYRRKTAPPKLKTLQEGIDVFKDMQNTLMTVSQLSQFDGYHPIKGTSKPDDGITDAMRAMDAMRAKRNGMTKRNDKYGFAGRAQYGPKVVETLNITKMSEFIKAIETGKINKVEVDTYKGCPMVVVDTNIDPSMLKVKHLYGVYLSVVSGNGYFTNTGSYLGHDGFIDVESVYDCNLGGARWHNIMFIPTKARAEYIAKPFPWNTTFPEFLSAKGYKHSATFEGFVNKTKIITPDSMENFAYGLSTTVSQPTTGELSVKMRFRINGNTIITIDKY